MRVARWSDVGEDLLIDSNVLVKQSAINPGLRFGNDIRR
jgi:hypothetical protein